MTGSSLRALLIRWLLLPIIAVGAVLGFVIYRSSVDLATEAFDTELAEQASSIATRFQIKEGLLNVDMPQAALDILTYDLSDQFFFSVTGPHGRSIAGNSSSFPAIPSHLKTSPHPAFYNGMMHGESVRIAVIALPVEQGSSQLATVQVAETLAGRQSFERRILLSLASAELTFFALLLGVLWLGIAQALKPLAVLTETVDRRAASDLTALPIASVPQEIAPLIVAINRLLDRVNLDVDMRNRFIANAAHQLRTPLAGLQTQSELALRTKDEKSRKQILEKIQVGCERAARVVHQLLILSRLEPNSPSITNTGVELNSLIAGCVEDFLELAIDKNVEISLDAPDNSISITGDALLLRELVRNLLDNAIKYTPSGGKVNVSLASLDGSVELCVSDTGAGIPDAERQKIFERFYRVEGSAPGGSGLGLAIVSEIAAAHNASVDVVAEQPSGSVFVLKFRKS
jgi:two-component system sensor histidine kinase TctE